MGKYKCCFSYLILTKHFQTPHIVFSVWILVLVSQISHAQIEMNFLTEKLVGSFTTKGLYKLLNGYGAESSQKHEKIIESIFTTFPRLLVPYERDNNALNSSLILEIINRATILNQAMYNDMANRTATLKEPVELWLSFPSQIINHLEKIMNSTTHANSIFPRTVSTLLLHSPGKLNHATLPVIIEDIKKSANFVKSNSSYNLTFGIVLDMKNCQGQNVEQIRSLPFNMIDLLSFKMSENPPFLSSLQELYENCRREVETRTPRTTDIGFFITNWSVSIDQTGGVKSKPENERILNSLKDWRTNNNVTLILEAAIPSKPATTVNDPTTNKETQVKNTEDDVAGVDFETLSKPIVFSKQYLGMTIANMNLNRSDNAIEKKFIPMLYDNTRKIMIGDVTNIDIKHWSGLKKFVDEIAEFKREKVRVKSSSGGVDIFENQVPIRLFVSMYISNDDVNISRRAIDNAGAIAGSGNGIHPQTVTGIALNCEEYPVLAENSGTENHWHRFIAPSVKYAKEIAARPNISKLQVCIILPIKFCKHFTSLNQLYPNLETVDMIIFKVDIPVQEIKTGGVPAAWEQVKANFQQCKRTAEVSLAQATRLTQRKIDLEFRVQPNGCDGSYDDIKGLSNLIQLWEEINIWAPTEQNVVTMDTAFDDPSRDGYCGWWKILEENGTVTFEDKKTTAKALYAKLNPNSTVSSPSDKGTDTNLLLVILLPTMLFVILLTAIASYLVIRYRARYVVGRQEADEFFKGVDERSELDATGILHFPENDGNCTAFCQPYDKESLEIPKASFTLDQKSSLGSGEFGIVCRGSVKRKEGEGEGVPVAVKMINDRKGGSIQGSNKALKGLMSEIKILSYVGDHKHIVALLGAYTAELRRGRVYVFLELCQMGSLDKHLRSFDVSKKKKDKDNDNVEDNNQDNKTSEENRDKYVNVEQPTVLDDTLLQDLLRWSQEICRGMEFLTEKNVVHADLATRNVLLNSEKSAKIADFGLSRRLYDYTNYVKKQQEPLPWRWMSPESLRRLEFNQKTDVWAFGVTLWEIYTLGDQPYPGLTWDVGFVSKLEGGLRLSEPPFKEGNIFKIMSSCWDGEPSRRPTFSQLAKMLKGNGALYVNDIGPFLKQN